MFEEEKIETEKQFKTELTLEEIEAVSGGTDGTHDPLYWSSGCSGSW